MVLNRFPSQLTSITFNTRASELIPSRRRNTRVALCTAISASLSWLAAFSNSTSSSVSPASVGTNARRQCN